LSGSLSRLNTTSYLEAILNPEDATLPRLECPAADLSRYEYLKAPSSAASEVKYYFALDLREALPLLPRLIGSVVEAIRFLGPSQCALSIVGGNSLDGTDEVLTNLKPGLEKLTTTYLFHSSEVNSTKGDRIAGLAELRNLALEPFYSDAERQRYTANTTIIFLNDVVICLEDILELVHQRQFQEADMTCAMDWVYVGRDPTFYDIWIARTLQGDSFFDIPPDGNWDSAWNLFWNDPSTRSRYHAHLPFQVYSCWNGATVFTAAPVVGGRISFRAPRKGECGQGEPQLFCKDMWHHGYGRIAVVPSVNLEYSNERGREIKDLKGYTSRWVKDVDRGSEKIEWNRSPPAKVKCMPTWATQSWQAWNETLT
jgi:alpha-1,3-mannosyltransferase